MFLYFTQRCRRFFLIGLALLSSLADAQDWPQRPVKIVYPYAAGGVGDAIFRIIGPGLESRLGQRFLIENKTGADGKIGALDVVNAKNDGYVLLLAPTANYAVNQHLFANWGYDPLTQLEPISLVAEAPLIAVGSVTGPQTLKELAQQAQANPQKFNFGSPGVGSPPHLAGVLYSQMNGNTIEHIGYRGTPPLVMALITGDIQLAFATVSALSTQLKANRLKGLAITSSQRLEDWPNIPTTREAGFPELTLTNWWILSAPKGTDVKIIQRISTELKAILAEPQVKAKLAEIGHAAMGWGPAESAAFIRTESIKYKNLIQRNNIKVD